MISFLVFCVLHLLTSANAKPPNIVFILVDDYGWNDVGYHGSEIRTPTLDKLAGEGVKLENYYVQPICTPSRSQFLSGKYQIHTGLQHSLIWTGMPSCIPLSDPTVADLMKKTGYATHMVGKWHVGFCKKECTPTYRGFDTFYGYYNGEEDYYVHDRCLNYGDDNRNVCGLDMHENVHKDTKPDWRVNGTYSAFLYANRVDKVLKDHVTGEDSDKPVFLYLALQSVHAPLQVPEEYVKPYSFIQNKERRTYAGMVSIMDETVANVTESLKKYGLWDNTLLVLSTDNGAPTHSSRAGNNWPLLGSKMTLWEGGIRGVGFIHGTQIPTEKRGTISRTLAHITDWFPTFVHIGGGSTEGLKLDGYNVWEAISQGKPSPRTEQLINIDPMFAPAGKRLYNDTFDNRVRAGIRHKNWKLVTGDPGTCARYPPATVDTPEDTEEYFDLPQLCRLKDPHQNIWLFDVENDPLESKDLSLEYPDVVRMLLDRLAYYNSTAVPVFYPPVDPQSNPDLHGGSWEPWLD